MKSSLSNLIIIIVLLAGVLLPACAAAGTVADGTVVALQNGTAMWIVKEALHGSYDSLILVNKDQTLALFVKAVGDGWGFVCMNLATERPIETFEQMGVGGNFTTPKTIGDLVSYLRDMGWEILPSSSFANVLLGVATNMSGFFPTFFVAPYGAFMFPDSWKYLEPYAPRDL